MEFLQKLSQEIFKQKYMINGEETPDNVFRGVAKEIASVEKTKKLRERWENEFYKIMSEGLFIPGGRILANARPDARLKNYNNCFTIEVEDSIDGIYTALREDALINAAGGGVGFNISHLRPRGTPTSRQGESSGPMSFLQVFDTSAKQIMTGGSRRGAHIAVMNIDHPDIEEFITAKHGDQNKQLTQFNLSVGITDAFISAVESDAPWDLQFNGKVYKTVKARDLYNLLAKNAFEHNEPGILNLDHVNNYNTGYYAFDIETTNPCGEIPMPNYSLCCLGSLNLTQFVQDPFGKYRRFDMAEFKKTISIAIRFLDNVLDATDYPLSRIEELSKQWRRIGLGFTGLADMFAMLGLPYGSEISKVFAEQLAAQLRDTTYAASVELAKEKGSFPALNKKKYVEGNFVKQLNLDIRLDIVKYGIRNVAMLTCAPTGTTSLSVGQNCSSGIEPIFSLSYDRKYRTGAGEETKTESVYDYAYLRYLEFCEKHELPKVLDDETKKWFATTFDVSPTDGIDIQAIFQKYIDHSISKTCNLPEKYSFEDYKELWMYAYKKGLKGFTTFNPSGSLSGILSTKKKEDVAPAEIQSFITRSDAPKRPDSLICDIHYVHANNQDFIVLAGLLNGSLYEIFVDEQGEHNLGTYKNGRIVKKSKGEYALISPDGNTLVDGLSKNFNGTWGSLARMISMSLRHGVPLQFIIDQLQRSKEFLGFEKAVSRVLKHYIKEGELFESGEKCKACGGTLVLQEGCYRCRDCGNSRCG